MKGLEASGWQVGASFLNYMDIDYTFNNALIKAYFEGDDSYIPLGELKYLHSHPLVMPNFITEVDKLILKAGKIMVDLKLSHLTEQLIIEAVIIGQGLKGPGLDITDESGLKILQALRRIYNMCNNLITGV